jgi:hypothetical protein
MVYVNNHQPKVVIIMHPSLIIALLALLLLPVTALAQTSPQIAAIESASPVATPAAKPADAGGVTREQYLQRAQERAGQRAGAHFDQMDTNHDGVLDPAEIRAWRSQHPRRAAAPSSQPGTQ